MKRILLASALLLASTAVHAETNVCTNITSLPYVITTPGVYCLNQDLSIAAGPTPEWAIKIQASNVVLDCNSHQISGTLPSPPPAPIINLNGIRFENGSSRSTIRNCRINGFGNAIRIGINSGTLPRPADLHIEDNRISNPTFGITGTAEGVSWIERNAILNTLGGGLQVSATTMVVRENYVSGSGNTTTVDGNGGYFSSIGANGIVAVEKNYFAEAVAPPGPTPSAVVYITAGNVNFQENIVASPSNPSDQGFMTQGVKVEPGASANCDGNVIVGYGGESNNPGCASANNRIY